MTIIISIRKDDELTNVIELNLEKKIHRRNRFLFKMGKIYRYDSINKRSIQK